MKTFDELYEMYVTDHESIYDLTDIDTICEFIDECDKDLSKYCEFKQVLLEMLDTTLDYELELAIMNGLDYNR